MLLPLLFALPWAAVLAFLLLRVRLPREIPAGPPARTPFVSVVVPARDEAVNIASCVASLTASTYPDFEVVVVDDRSCDGTGALARAMGPGNARALRVLDGSELPEGWLGKPWACSQGAGGATGELLLFTDADTVHGPDLLARAVAALEEDRADLLTLTGRQLMGSFWERLVQPQIFLMMIFRFHDIGGPVEGRRWRDAIANGQFLLFRRDAYDALGGHAAVKHEVAEDLAMAQRVVRQGRRLSVRMAETAFATRMYRSLGELVAGWSKNLVMGGMTTVPPRLRPLTGPAMALTAAGLWLAPPVAMAAAALGAGGPGVLLWSAAATILSALLWVLFTARMGAPPAYGLLYPLGAAVGMWIFLRSWVQGRSVEWKGRKYLLRDLSEVP
ncbi:MAG TPA: glycosyltransferase family 2 protein [Longimicrobiales bacterium]|nr:glycosyltransferase family 2 protein [Longimicrobiales bacterium]